VPVSRVFLLRIGGCADLVGADGHRPALRWIGKRHDEFRLRYRRDHLAGGLRQLARLDRQLDDTVLWIDRVAAIGCRSIILHASGPSVHGEPIEAVQHADTVPLGHDPAAREQLIDLCRSTSIVGRPGQLVEDKAAGVPVGSKHGYYWSRSHCESPLILRR
jgi:hypothetical protein